MFAGIPIQENIPVPTLKYLHLGSSQRRWIHVTDRNNASVIIGAAPISARVISWAPMLGSLSCGPSLTLVVSLNLSNDLPC